MEKKFKKEILIFLTAISILTILLSTGLSDMIFKKGMPLPELDLGEGTVSIPDDNISSTIQINKLAMIILIIIIAVGIMITLYKMIKKINWKDFNATFLYILLVVILVSIGIVFAILLFLPHSVTPPTELIAPLPEETKWSPLGEAPIALVWFIGFILAALVTLIVIMIVRSKKQKEYEPLNIELEALFARNEIQSGKELKDVILRCYHRMCLALQDEQEIEREESMTASEFEERIEAAGAPQKSVHQLTRLFEAVRYGNWKPGPTEEKEAIKCFDDIIRYFSEVRKDDGKN